MFDFGTLPPEINSGRMYSGPGSGPMLAAASAWDSLATELGLTATGYGSVIGELVSSPWVGPAAQSMLSAVTPYVSWLTASAALAEETAGQGRAAAAAYEAAFLMTVPPPVIAANRVLLMTLIATNFFGQNTGAIAATETQYFEMWAQDAAAMYGYAAASAIATELNRFVEPANTTIPDAVPLQAEAVSQATATQAGSAAQAGANQLFSAAAVPQALQQVAASPAAAIEPNFIWNSIRDFLTYGLPTPTNNWAGLAPAQYTTLARGLQAYFGVGLASFGTQIEQQLFNGLGTTAGAGGAWYPTPQFAALGAGGWHYHGGAGLTASIGTSAKVGALSVPTSWATTPGAAHAALPKVMSASLVTSPGATASPNVASAPGAMPLGGRAGQRGGNMGMRYGFRYNVLARPPSAG